MLHAIILAFRDRRVLGPLRTRLLAAVVVVIVLDVVGTAVPVVLFRSRSSWLHVTSAGCDRQLPASGAEDALGFARCSHLPEIMDGSFDLLFGSGGEVQGLLLSARIERDGGSLREGDMVGLQEDF